MLGYDSTYASHPAWWTFHMHNTKNYIQFLVTKLYMLSFMLSLCVYQFMKILFKVNDLIYS